MACSNREIRPSAVRSAETRISLSWPVRSIDTTTSSSFCRQVFCTWPEIRNPPRLARTHSPLFCSTSRLRRRFKSAAPALERSAYGQLPCVASNAGNPVALVIVKIEHHSAMPRGVCGPRLVLITVRFHYLSSPEIRPSRLLPAAARSPRRARALAPGPTLARCGAGLHHSLPSSFLVLRACRYLFRYRITLLFDCGFRLFLSSLVFRKSPFAPGACVRVQRA